MSAVLGLEDGSEVFQSIVGLGATRLSAVGHCKHMSSRDVFVLVEPEGF